MINSSIVIVTVGILMSVELSVGSTEPITSRDVLEDLDSLLSSKILLDHPAPTFSSPLEISIHGNQEEEEVGGTTMIPKQGAISAADTSKKSDSMYDSNNNNASSIEKINIASKVAATQFLTSGSRNLYEISSPIHVARCRATCLQVVSRLRTLIIF